MNESQLVRIIKAHIAKGDKAKDKAEQHYIAAGQYLKQLKDDCPDQQTFLEKVEKEIRIGKSRAYELLQIGDGRKTVAEVRADTAKRVAKHDQSCPLANGQNADDPAASAEARKALYAADDPAPPEQEVKQANLGDDRAIRSLIYTRIVEGLGLILASPKGRNLTDDFLREIFEEFLTKRRRLLKEAKPVISGTVPPRAQLSPKEAGRLAREAYRALQKR
jgi:hypothetical protein